MDEITLAYVLNKNDITRSGLLKPHAMLPLKTGSFECISEVTSTWIDAWDIPDRYKDKITTFCHEYSCEPQISSGIVGIEYVKRDTYQGAIPEEIRLIFKSDLQLVHQNIRDIEFMRKVEGNDYREYIRSNRSKPRRFCQKFCNFLAFSERGFNQREFMKLLKSWEKSFQIGDFEKATASQKIKYFQMVRWLLLYLSNICHQDQLEAIIKEQYQTEGRQPINFEKLCQLGQEPIVAEPDEWYSSVADDNVRDFLAEAKRREIDPDHFMFSDDVAKQPQSKERIICSRRPRRNIVGQLSLKGF